MRPVGRESWRIVTTVCVIGWVAASVGGCTKEETTSPPGKPALQVRAYGSCDTNTLPTSTASEIAELTMERAEVRVTGTDPSRSSSEIEPGTTVKLYVGNGQGAPGGTGGYFLSTLDADNPIGLTQSKIFQFAGGAVLDDFYCGDKPGTYYLYAYGPDFGGPGKHLTMEKGDGWPIRCVERQKWRCDCLGECEPDLAPPDVPPDLQLPPDGDTDAEVGVPDVEPLPSSFVLAYDGVRGEDLILGIRASVAANRPNTVVIKWKLTENGEVSRRTGAATFELMPNSPPDVLIDPDRLPRTLPDGSLVTVVTSGNTPGQLKVLARIRVPVGTPAEGEEQEFIELEELSPEITIQAGVPTASGMSFQCGPRLVPAFIDRRYAPLVAPMHDGDYWELGIVPDAAACSVSLTDRLLDRVGEGVTVRFTTEAGAITPQALTDSTGRAVATHDVCCDIPADTQPAEWEDAFRFNLQQGRVANPRDGLVRIIAVTRGEESFIDLDGDHQFTDQDLHEVGQDLTEPFVDTNDNGTWDEGEPFDDITDPQGRTDGIWNSSNGVWDEDTAIWTGTWVVWTGSVSESPYAYYGATTCQDGDFDCGEGCTGDCALPAMPNPAAPPGNFAFAVAGGRVGVTAYPTDRNGNCVGDGTATLTMTATTLPAGFEPIFLSSGESEAGEQIDVECAIDGNIEQPSALAFGDALLDSRDVNHPPAEGFPPLEGQLVFVIEQPTPFGVQTFRTVRSFTMPGVPPPPPMP